MSRKVLPITTILLSLLFVYMAARAVISLNFELIDARGSGSPVRFEEWARIVLAPLMLIAVCGQSYFLARRRNER
jgi:hypothetical protein